MGCKKWYLGLCQPISHKYRINEMPNRSEPERKNWSPEEKKRLVQKSIFIFESFILVGRLDPKYPSDPFCHHEEFDEGSKWVLGERGVNIDYIPKNIYMYIYIYIYGG